MGLFSRFKKSESPKRTCVFCGAEIPEGKVGGVILDKHLCCRDCQPKMVASALPMTAMEKKRDMTIQELREFELLWNSKGIGKGMEQVSVNRAVNEICGQMPGNARRYELVKSFDQYLVFALNCPHCAKLVVITVAKEELNKVNIGQGMGGNSEPSNPFMQAFWFLNMKEAIEINCPHCKASVVAMK